MRRLIPNILRESRGCPTIHGMTPTLAQDPFDWQALHALILRAFAGMEGRIDPPSSARDLTPEGLAQAAGVWTLGTPPIACVTLTPFPTHLYIGKLAVNPAHQRQGLARALLTHAETRARALDLPELRLRTRVELTENQATFRALGFTETARTAHQGYSRPTSITFSKFIFS